MAALPTATEPGSCSRFNSSKLRRRGPRADASFQVKPAAPFSRAKAFVGASKSESREGFSCFTKALVTAVVVIPVIAVAAFAQQSGIKRTPLQTVDFPAGYNVVSVIAEIPSGCAGRHTH